MQPYSYKNERLYLPYTLAYIEYHLHAIICKETNIAFSSINSMFHINYCKHHNMFTNYVAYKCLLYTYFYKENVTLICNFRLFSLCMEKLLKFFITVTLKKFFIALEILQEK